MLKVNLMALGMLVIASAASAQVVPADPIGHLDGVWHGESVKVEVTVKGGVATVTGNTSDDMHVKSLAMAPGTVIGRFTSFTLDGKSIVRLHGGCWLTSRPPKLGDCGDFNAVLRLGMASGKPVNLLKINTMQLFRRADISKYTWDTRN